MACAEPYTVPIARRGIKMPFCFTGYDWPKRPKFLRQRTKKRYARSLVLVRVVLLVRVSSAAASASPVLATMSRLLRGKIFCSYGSNFLKSHTFTKMTLRFSSQNLPRWRRFSLTSKKILQVAVAAGAATATVCGGIIYWSSGTIDSN